MNKKEVVGNAGKNNPVSEKYFVIVIFFLVFLILFSGGFGIVSLFKNKFYSANVCGDGTSYDSCSAVKPYYCLGGTLIQGATVCGCPEGFEEKGNTCISIYSAAPKEINLNYVLRGEEDVLEFVVYGGVVNHLSSVPKSIISSEEDAPSRGDFKLKNLDEEVQRDFLLPLVVEIQGLTKDKEDQARIAISIVQNIPFGNSNKSFNFGANEVSRERYAYEVLYDMQGVCGEKTELLAFLLREIGYGVSFFYYSEENHEALGIKCPEKKSFNNSGYCFVETTAPSIITDNEINYFDVGKLQSSPEIYLISEGNLIEDGFYEYRDANKMKRIRKSIEKNNRLGFGRHFFYKHLKKKYGLVSEYYGG